MNDKPLPEVGALAARFASVTPWGATWLEREKAAQERAAVHDERTERAAGGVQRRG